MITSTVGSIQMHCHIVLTDTVALGSPGVDRHGYIHVHVHVYTVYVAADLGSSLSAPGGSRCEQTELAGCLSSLGQSYKGTCSTTPLGQGDPPADSHTSIVYIHVHVHVHVYTCIYHSDDVTLYYAQVVYSVYTPGYTTMVVYPDIHTYIIWCYNKCYSSIHTNLL